MYNFPASPTAGQEYTPSGGPTYVWQSPRWLVKAPAPFTAETRNRVVNGAMQISQENGSAAVVFGYPADQWFGSSPLPTVTFTRLAGPSASGGKQLDTTIVTAKPSLAAGDYWQLTQYIEGIRVADFRWGSAAAKQVILRFWAFTNNPGTYTVSLSGGGGQFYLAPFTLPNGAWTEIVIVVPGATVGTWATDTSLGLTLNFGFAAGSTYAGGAAGWGAVNKIQIAGNTNGAALANRTFFIADVGLYLDPNNTGIAPPWQMPDEAEELRACQRYWTSLYNYVVETGAAGQSTVFPTEMRIAPAISGGGAGFALQANTPRSVLMYQTTRNVNALTFNARM